MEIKHLLRELQVVLDFNDNKFVASVSRIELARKLMAMDTPALRLALMQIFSVADYQWEKRRLHGYGESPAEAMSDLTIQIESFAKLIEQTVCTIEVTKKTLQQEMRE